MSNAGKRLYTKVKIDAAVALFAALSHPLRLRVLSILSQRGPMAAGALQDLAKVEQSALSHQLRVLRNARLVRTERSGRQVIYHLSDDHVSHIVADGIAHAQKCT